MEWWGVMEICNTNRHELLDVSADPFIPLVLKNVLGAFE